MVIVNLLRGADLFQGLPDEELGLIAQICQEQSYTAGERIFAEDSTGDELYVLKKGKVGIELAVRGEAMFTALHIVDEGQVFGEMALVDRGHRSATAKSLVPSEILMIPREELFRLFDRNNHIGYVVMRNIATVLAARLRKTNLQLMNSLMWK
jgi:CRP-like cAMP-binding protein